MGVIATMLTAAVPAHLLSANVEAGTGRDLLVANQDVIAGMKVIGTASASHQQATMCVQALLRLLMGVPMMAVFGVSLLVVKVVKQRWQPSSDIENGATKPMVLHDDDLQGVE